MSRRDVGESWRARAAVEVFIPAPNGEVDAPRVELGRHDASGMTEVPEHERASLVHRGGDPFDIGKVAGAVGDVVEHDERGRVRERDAIESHVARLDPAQRQPQLVGNPLEHVAIGWKVVAVDDELCAVWVGCDRRPHEFVEQHRRRVANRHLPGCRTKHHATEVVANVLGLLHPALVPAANQSPAPLLGHEVSNALHRSGQRSTERVAVEVGDDVGRASEEVAVVGEWVSSIELVHG